MMLLNPFVEGLIVLVLGIACYVLAAFVNKPELSTLGSTLAGIGIGYLGHTALVAPPPGK